VHFLTSILLLLVASRLLGEIVHRLKQPRIVGEILAGVLLGPAVLKLVHPTPELQGISELSIFLVVLSAGLEMNFSEVIRAIRGRGALAGLIGFLVPLVMGTVLGLVFGLGSMRSLFLGLCMSVTALPVTIHVLNGFGILNSRIAQVSIATAILNDVLALLLLGVILDMPGSNVSGDMAPDQGLVPVIVSLLKGSAKIGLFALFVFVVSQLIRRGSGQSRYIENLVARIVALFGKEALFGLAVVFVLAFGSISETLGTHFVVGTFFGALLISRDVFGEQFFRELEGTVNSISTGFLAPVFFAYLGLLFGVEGFQRPVLLVAVLAIAVVSKIFAGYWGGRVMQMSESESLGLGIILNGRGIMELVVANIAYQRGMIGIDIFSILVLMGIFTTVLTPILFRHYAFTKLSDRERGSASQTPPAAV
jgi:Kef-type K+ transport system membrane component KefB